MRNIRSSVDQKPSSNLFTRPSFYLDKPTGSLTLADAEHLGSMRLDLLRTIDEQSTTLSLNDANAPKTFESKQLFESRVLELLRKNFRSLEDDKISHYLLRIAFCQTEELRRWFVKTEDLMFRIRFNSFLGDAMARSDDHMSDIVQFFRDNEIEGIEQIMFRDLEPLIQMQLRSSFYNLSLSQETKFFRVPWLQVFRLCAQQRCVLHRGLAYITSDALAELVSTKFRSELADHLNVIFTATTSQRGALHDRRVAPILNQLAKQHVNSTAAAYKPKLGDASHSITRDQIPAVRCGIFFVVSFSPLICVCSACRAIVPALHAASACVAGTRQPLETWRSYAVRSVSQGMRSQYAGGPSILETGVLSQDARRQVRQGVRCILQKLFFPNLTPFFPP